MDLVDKIVQVLLSTIQLFLLIKVLVLLVVVTDLSAREFLGLVVVIQLLNPLGMDLDTMVQIRVLYV